MSGGDEAQLGVGAQRSPASRPVIEHRRRLQDGRGTPTPFSGVIPRSLAYLIDRIDALSATATFSVQASFLEIYNEVPRDLLRPSATGLYVRWAHDGGFFVENQVVVDCQSPGDLMAVFAEGVHARAPGLLWVLIMPTGHRNRHVAAHILNSDSSRSHCILTVYIKASAHGRSVACAGPPGPPDDDPHRRRQDDEREGLVRRPGGIGTLRWRRVRSPAMHSYWVAMGRRSASGRPSRRAGRCCARRPASTAACSCSAR